MNRVLRGPLRQFAVQVALGTMVVVLVVGTVLMVQVSEALDRNERTHYREHLEHSRAQLLDQFAILQDINLVATIWVSSLDAVTGAIEAEDPERAIGAIYAAYAPFGFSEDAPPTLILYSLDGQVIGSTFPTGPEPASPEMLARAIEGRPVRAVRDVSGLGPAAVASAVVRGSDGEPIAVLESAWVIDPRMVTGYADLLGLEVAAIYQGRTIGSSSDAFDPVSTEALPSGAVEYVDLAGGRYLLGLVPVPGPDGMPSVQFVVGVSESEVGAAIDSARGDILPIIVLGAAMGVVLSFGAAWLTSRRMRGLVAAAQEIRANELDQPVPVEGAGEIRELAEAMEGMREAIREGRAALLATNRDLALRVDTSTASLAQVTHELSVMHQIMAQLDGEPPGGFPGVVQTLADLEWVDGVMLAIVEEGGRLSPAAVSGLPSHAGRAVVEALNRPGQEQALAGTLGDGIYVATTAEHPRFGSLAGEGIGGLAVQAMQTPDGVAGVVVVTAERRLTLTPQREDLLRSVAREVAQTLERTELADEAEESRRIADSVLREMLDGVLVLNHEHVCRIANPAAARLLGRSRAEIVGHAATEYLPVTEQDLETRRRRGGAGQASLVTEMGERQVAISLTPFADPDPERAGLIVMLRDLSAEAEAERVKQDFVAMVGHELRTPLTLIRTTVDLLHEEDAGELNETQERIVGVLRSNSDRLMALISDLLDMSALDAGRMHIQPDWMDLVSAATSAVEALRGPAATKQHTVQVDAPEELTAWADRSRVEQVVANLVSNAIKYTPPGGTITVSVGHTGDGMAEVAVRDDGMGVPPGEQQRLFEKFYRTPAGQRATGGTGLGLAIARSLVELHGGTIRVESDGGSGSTFAFTVPTQQI